MTRSNASASELIHDLSLDLELRKNRERVDQLLLAALDSGPSRPYTKEGLQRIRQEGLRRLADSST